MKNDMRRSDWLVSVAAVAMIILVTWLVGWIVP